MNSKRLGIAAVTLVILVVVALGMRRRLVTSVEVPQQSAGLAPVPLAPVAQSSAPAQEPQTNRLINEKSPYLLQHAENPVDWYPWGPEAFREAQRKSKPIFLSVGYSTCHWCHVMERESFSNPQIAAIMNQHFVSIKVDREERPDVDSVYMAFVQATTGSGGWPMSVFVTPQLQPFFGGTYFPPKTFENLLLRVAGEWQDNRAEILTSAGRFTDQLKEFGDVQGGR